MILDNFPNLTLCFLNALARFLCFFDGNQNGLNIVFIQCFQRTVNLAELFDQLCLDIIDVVKWHYSMQVPPQTLSVRCDEYLETYTRYWERINDGNILTPFRNALYAARRSDMICFRPLEDVDSSFECQKEILYDDTYYYTSTALLKKIIKVQLRSYMPSDVLNRLKTAGVLSGSVPKTLTFAPNESKDFRFRTLLRSSLHQPGSRDLVEI